MSSPPPVVLVATRSEALARLCYFALQQGNLRYDIEVAATIIVPEGKLSEEHREEFAEKLAAHENAVRDRLSCLIRSANPQHLNEPGLEVIRRQIMAELGKVLGGEKLFERILLPRWTVIRADM